VGALTPTQFTAISAGLASPKPPAKIGQKDILDLHRSIDDMERADHASGGRSVIRLITLAHLRWAQETTATASFRSAQVRTAWLCAVARLGRLAGFMNADAREHTDARRCYVTALHIAASAAEGPTRIHVLAGMARQAVGTAQTSVDSGRLGAVRPRGRSG
jgi:hypothetical protein